MKREPFIECGIVECGVRNLGILGLAGFEHEMLGTFIRWPLAKNTAKKQPFVWPILTQHFFCHPMDTIKKTSNFATHFCVVFLHHIAHVRLSNQFAADTRHIASHSK